MTERDAHRTAERVTAPLLACSPSIEFRELPCGDGFSRRHWRAECSAHAYEGPWRFYRSHAQEDTDCHASGEEPQPAPNAIGQSAQ